MPVSFNHIPDSLRVPLFYAELDASRAGFFQRALTSLLLGLKTSGGTAPANELIQVTSAASAETLFGKGSQLASMVDVYKRNDPFTELWCIPLSEAGGATALKYVLTFAANATKAGTFYFEVGRVRVAVQVTVGQTPAATATALAAAINARKDSGFEAEASAAVVTITSISKGAVYIEDEMAVVKSTDPDLVALAPTGQTATLAAAVVGTGASPSLAAAITAMGEKVFDAVVCPFHDSTSLDALKAEFNESAGRWSYTRQLYGHVYAAAKGTVAGLGAIGEGAGRNNPHELIVGIPSSATRAWSPTPSWLWATAAAAQTIKSASNDPARPLQTLPLYGCFLDERAAHTLSEQNTLLFDGVSTINVVAGTPRISRLITTYRLNPSGEPDTAYLDVTTLYTLAHILRYLKSRITSKFGRHKLANDGIRIGEGQALVTPRLLRAELIAGYAQLEAEGLVENHEQFVRHLIVERDINDPNRVNVLYPPDLVNQLRVFAVVAQFRLQYEAQADEDTE